MKYEYKFVPVPNYLVKSNSDKSMSDTLIRTISELVANTTNNGEWEYYRTDNYNVYDLPGCLSELFGGKPQQVNFNLLVFRKKVD